MKNPIAFFLVLFFSFCFVFESAAQREAGTSRKIWCTVGDSVGRVRSEQINLTEQDAAASGRLIQPGGKIIIPVVVHVLYHPSVPAQNVSDAYVDAQLQILNGTLNPVSTGVPAPFNHMSQATMAIELRKACIDPQGNPTTGIIRKQMPGPGPYFPNTTSGTITYPDLALAELGGSAAWPSDKYLNIWIGNMDEPYGLAMFPWNRNNITTVDINSIPTAFSNTNFDGITLDYEIFPEPMLDPNDPVPLSDKNRVPTHEIGHWLGLYHIFSGCPINNQGDMVDDTPAQYIANLVCPPTGSVVDRGLCPGEPNPPGIMYLNYMDLSPSSCMKLFTAGQRTRARSYFSQTGPTGTRYPFLQNYFSIKQPYQLQNNTLTVYLNNPACINVTYSFTGPVTEISHDNQKIVFSAACSASGTVSVTATAENYVDDYTFSFNNSTCIWPKVYQLDNKVRGLTKGFDDNIFLTIGIGDIQNSYNHIGATTTLSNQHVLIHYQPDGTTNWIGDKYGYLFPLQNGDIRVESYPNFIHYNGTTGATVASPSYLPADAKVIGESLNGEFISFKWHVGIGGEFFVHSATNTTSITCNAPPTTFFNAQTNKLYVHKNIQFQGVFEVYDLINGTLNLAATGMNVPPGVSNVDNQGKAYLLDNFGVLKSYNYQTGQTATITIPGFNNSNLILLNSDWYYTKDKIILFNKNDFMIYVIDLVSLLAKKISTTNIYTGTNTAWIIGAVVAGDNVYLAGYTGDQSTVTIGNQTIPSIPGNTNFGGGYITKLSITNDFSRQTPSFESKLSYEVTLFPNPVTQSMRISIKDLSFSGKDKKYVASVFDQSGNRMLQKENYQPGTELNTAILKPGVYYLEIADQFGERTGKTFMKL